MPTASARGSVVIPAHNEARVIGRCLTSLTRGLSPGELDIVVVANACSDATAAIARTFPVQVVETHTPGKANALNLGDEVVTAFPRIYLDADVLLRGEDALRLASHLASEPVLAAAPSLRWSTAGVGPLCRAYYREWTRRSYVTDRMIGSGVYALSEAGRARFDRFPDLISDDGFMLSLFSYDERATVPNCSFMIYPPLDIRSLLKVKTRVEIGTYQLAARGIHPRQAWRPGGITTTLRPDVDMNGAAEWVLYSLIRVVVRVAATYRLRTGKTSWLRDESSREQFSAG
jgi:glycosyltransferase involved in cell wall biosynthesis